MTYRRNDTRSTVQIEANRLDRDIYHLAASIDQLCEMSSRGKPKMFPELIEAARSVASARTAVRKLMHPRDLVETIG